MKPTEKEGGAAFPWANDSNKEYYWINHGMSLRDYFAAKAVTLFTLEDKHVVALQKGAQPAHDIVAKFCYDLADAMLAARKEGA